jgi:hypothetical protein
MFQTVESEMTLISDAELPVSQFPLEVSYVLKKMDVQILANGLKAGFNTTSDSHSFSGALNARLIGQPVQLHFDALRNLKTNPHFDKKLAELPLLEDLNLKDFLVDWFQHIFALLGKDLTLGSSHKIALKDGVHPATFYYTITNVTDEKIEADLKGFVEAQGIKIDGQKCPGAEINLKSKISGHLNWDRKNAFVHQLESRSNCSGTLKIADAFWSLNMQMKHHFQSYERP